MPNAAPPFEPEAYGPEVAEWLATPRLCELGPGPPCPFNAEGQARLLEWCRRPDFARPVVDELAALACAAGLLCHFDLWGPAHEVAQDLATPEGSYWHAILHRREPDAFNAKYWFRRVDGHPVAAELARESGYHTPTRFVDLCEQLRGAGGVAEERARRLAWLEWRRLFDHCFRLAVGA